MAYHRALFAAVVFASVISQGSCIYCFYCNSANNSACLDIAKFDGETLARMIPVVNCHAATQVSMDFFCRKIVQTIYHSDHESEVRVTRGCGWMREENRDCYRADNSDHLETVCQCFTDRCNSADASADPATTVLLFLVFSAVLYFYR